MPGIHWNMAGGPGGPECRCTPYDHDDYPYPQSIEAEIADRLGGMVRSLRRDAV